jgi:hypothetical protein
MEGQTGVSHRIETLGDRMRVYCDQAHLEAERARVDRKFLMEFMLNVQDLLIEFSKTADWMKFKRQIHRRVLGVALWGKKTVKSGQ